MSSQELLDACLSTSLAAPGDDAPRLVWADAVGGERGELVVIQCDLARGQLSAAEAGARRRRERELLGRHGAVWSGLAGLARDVEFRRGFVEAAMIDAAVFLELGREIFEGAPHLCSITVTGLTEAASSEVAASMVAAASLVPLVERVLESPFLARLSGLDIIGAGTRIEGSPMFAGIGDGIATIVARAGTIRGLRSFGIGFSRLGARGAHALVASGDLEGLDRLWLREHQLGDDAVIAVIRQCPRLQSLDIVGQLNAGAMAGVLPALRELRLGAATDRSLALLAASRAAFSLEVLAIENGHLEDAGALIDFPRLRSLDVKNVRFSKTGVRAFARTELPALRRLRLGTQLAAHDIATLARAFGPQLETFDTRGANLTPSVVRELQTLVAGEVLTSMGEHVPTSLL